MSYSDEERAAAIEVLHAISQGKLHIASLQETEGETIVKVAKDLSVSGSDHATVKITKGDVSGESTYELSLWDSTQITPVYTLLYRGGLSVTIWESLLDKIKALVEKRIISRKVRKIKGIINQSV